MTLINEISTSSDYFKFWMYVNEIILNLKLKIYYVLGNCKIILQTTRWMHGSCVKSLSIITCHCSSCWDNSIFCWTASISWLLTWRTSILVLASSICTELRAARAASRRLRASARAESPLEVRSARARSRSSVVAVSWASHTPGIYLYESSGAVGVKWATWKF